MKQIVVSIQNGLLAETISHMLAEGGEFFVYRSVPGKKNCLAADCKMQHADLLLAEVNHMCGSTLKERLAESRQVQKNNPACKIALLCDENTMPDLARDVAMAKRDGFIDAFFYSSVTGSYLVAALAAL